MTDELAEYADSDAGGEVTPARTRTCANCGSALGGDFCQVCGQQDRDIRRFFWVMIHEAFDDVFRLNSRAARTVAGLLFRPSFLTRQYLMGKRAHYVPPLRLYLVTSILFFTTLSIATLFSNQAGIVIDGDNAGNDASDNAETVMEDMRNDLTLSIPFLDPETEAEWKETLIERVGRATAMIEDDPGRLADVAMDIAPVVIFLLLPLFALLLKLTYLGSGRYYAEHLLFAVHEHAFVFLVLLLGNIIGWLSPLAGTTVTETIDTLLSLWILVYLFLSLKWMYEDGTFVTVLRSAVIVTGYSILFVIATLIGLVWGVLTL